MELKVKWQSPIELLNGDKDSLTYVAEGLDDWRETPGVYIFARIFNDSVTPLYIGKAERLGVRAWQHFKNSTSLMNKIKKSSSGKKVILLGQFSPKPGQNIKKCIALIERALIDHALTEGYKLLNKQGTKTPAHTVTFSGFLGAREVTGKTIRFKAAG